LRVDGLRTGGREGSCGIGTGLGRVFYPESPNPRFRHVDVGTRHAPPVPISSDTAAVAWAGGLLSETSSETMITFGYPDNLEDAKPLMKVASAAFILMLPIVMGDTRYTGVFPRGRQAVNRAVTRTIAVIALLYPIAGTLGRAPVATIVGFVAGILLLVMAPPLGSERSFCLTCGSFSILSGVLLGILFPAISSN
jgi:hypothetical protein